MTLESSTDLVPVGEFGPFDVLSDLVHGYYVDGFAERCVTASHRLQAFVEAAGDELTTRYLIYSRAVAQQQLGRYDEAVATARSLLARLDAHETAWRAKGLAIVAEASARAGHPGRALSALAEADWLCVTLPRGTYGRKSATMAVALALRSLELFEQADERLSSREFRTSPEVDLLATQERAQLGITWGVSLLLTGDRTAATAQFRRTAELGLRLRRLAAELGSAAMAARGVMFEAYSLMRLGEPELAEAQVRAIADTYEYRPELVETQLGRLVLASAAARAGDYDDAREQLQRTMADVDRQHRAVWFIYANIALAQLDVQQHGETPATRTWRAVAQHSLQRLWAEREARFEALRDREHVRRLTAETDRMGRAILQDPLTGLGNRLMLRATLEARPRPPAVVFVDVDDFKAVNDRFSHAVGDDVLIRIGHLLRSLCRPDDVVVRYGGDEFLVLTHADDRAETIAHRIHRTMAEADWSDLADELRITVSVGVGKPGTAGDGVDADAGVVLALADAALLAAKRAGRNRVATA